MLIYMYTFHACVDEYILLCCNDDQVIKHAAVINLTSDNEMTITPYQIAPCHMKSIESSRWQLLKLGVTVPIKPGDVCTLLPDKCWFKIISVPERMENNEDSILKRKADEDIDCNITNDKRFCSGEGDNSQSSCSALDEILNNNDINKINVEKTVINENNLLYNNDEDKMQDLNSTSMCEHHNMDQSSVIKEDYKVQNMNIEDNKPSTSEQILSLKENLDLPCINENNEIAMVKDTESSISNGQESETSNNTTINNFRRNKCKYGKKCYRKNSQHKNKFSHPGDSDYDISDNRQECPYGSRCYRKNPQHKVEFKHSDTNITNKRKKRNSKRTEVQESLDTLSGMEDSSVEESAEESVDESDYEPSDIESFDDDEMHSDKNESELENDIAD
ncbi:hypothetical protein K0M31_013872 [Melipona bicolor]|uniref:PBZ-type domain-containing protein n=1 Tax=Melipona bicolor TaxID=60889 RepID=A0AA40G7G1_9HYME|nr:hypothetical protein K0M31_013872 [Melipona bicolor]